MGTKGSSFVLVVGHGSQLEHEEGAAAILRQLGAEVRAMDLWQDTSSLFQGDEQPVARVILVEGGERPDLATVVLRALRREPFLADIPALISLPTRQVGRFEPTAGFDDFVLYPYVPAELYARIRALEWRRSEFTTDERIKVGSLVIDKSAHEVMLDGRRVAMTAKEFSLLLFLASNRGKVFTRDVLLAKVWGPRYDGGARTVDIHVRRLRAKLGDSLPLETLRGAGYKLRAPHEAMAQ